MADKMESTELELFSQAPLLITESREEFDSLAEAFMQEIEPSGPIEQMYAAEIAILTWEIARLRRCKIAIVNGDFRDALGSVVRELAGQPHSGTAEREWVDNLCFDWFSKPKAKKEVLNLLDQFRLDESAIEAKAIERNLSKLEVLDRMLTSLEARRNKALHMIAEYRVAFADQLKDVSNRVIESEVSVLVDRSTRASA